MVAICSSKATTSPRADTATSPSRRRRLIESSVRTDSSRLREWITAAAIAPEQREAAEEQHRRAERDEPAGELVAGDARLEEDVDDRV